jgi:hypothetical protein
MSKIDWTKPIKLNDGRPARFLGKVSRLNFNQEKQQGNAIAVEQLGAAHEVVFVVNDEGFLDEATVPYAPIRVRNVVEKLKTFANVFQSSVDGELVMSCYGTREEANKWFDGIADRRVALLELEFERGEGLK